MADWLTKSIQTNHHGHTKRRKLSSTQFDTKVQQMKQIVGATIDESTIRSCLFLSQNNLEQAIDRFFNLDRSTSANESSSSLVSNDVPGPTGVAPNSAAPIQLGWTVVVGRCSSPGSKKNALAVGDELILVRDSIGSPFVRWSKANDPLRHLGTLEPRIAAFLGPLMDDNLLILNAKAQVLPDGPLTSFSSIQIGLDIRMPELGGLHTDAKDRKRQHIYNLVVHLYPQIQARIELEKQRQQNIKDEHEDQKKVNNLFDEDDQNEEEDDGGSSRNMALDNPNRFHYPEDVDPIQVHRALQNGLRITLKDYQVAGLQWMMSRERGGGGGGSGGGSGGGGDTTTTNARSLVHSHAALLDAHPLWLTVPLAQEQDHTTNDGPPLAATAATIETTTDTINIYVNPYSKEIQTGTSSPELKPCRGGILADEMGLGKTIETLALLVVDKTLRLLKRKDAKKKKQQEQQEQQEQEGEQDEPPKKRKRNINATAAKTNKETKATLIVVPTSVLGQWQEEIKKRTKTGILTFVEYYGTAVNSSGGGGNNGGRGDVKHSSSSSSSSSSSASSNAFKSLNYISTHDVVLTTFGTISAEMQRLDKATTTTKNRHTTMAPPTTGLLSIHWRRVVLDEAHAIKNRATTIARACCAIRAPRRWALTGTPMQVRQILFMMVLVYVGSSCTRNFQYRPSRFLPTQPSKLQARMQCTVQVTRACPFFDVDCMFDLCMNAPSPTHIFPSTFSPKPPTAEWHRRSFFFGHFFKTRAVVGTVVVEQSHQKQYLFNDKRHSRQRAGRRRKRGTPEWWW